MKKNFEQLSLFNYKKNKIKSPPAPKLEPQNQPLDTPAPINNQALQSLTATTEELQKRIKNVENNSQCTASTLQASITQNATNISSLSNSVATHASNISALQSANTTNQSNIATLQSSVATNTSNISSLNTTISGISTNLTTAQTNISNLQSAVSTNTGNISTLSNSVSSLQSSVSSLSSGVATNAGNISQNSSDISSLSSRVSACESSISQLGGSPSASTDLFTIPNVDFKGPVYSVCDTFERKYLYALNHDEHFQKIHFLVEKFTTFTLDLSITFSALSYSSPQYLELYLDDQLIDTREYTIAQNQTLTFDFSLSHYSTTGYHNYHFKVNSGLYFSYYQHHLYSRAKLYGKNALFISRKNLINSAPCPNGTYYLTRTVNGYGQYASFATGTAPTNLTWTDVPNSANFYGAGHSYLPYYTRDANDNVTHLADLIFVHLSTGGFTLYNYTNQTQLSSGEYFAFIGQSSYFHASNYEGVALSTMYSNDIYGQTKFLYSFDGFSGGSLNKSYYSQFNIPIPERFADVYAPKELVAFNTNNRPTMAFHVDEKGMLTALANFGKPIRKQVGVQIDFGSQPNAYFINDNADMVVLYNQYNFIKCATLVLDRTHWSYSVTNTQILGNAQEMRKGWSDDLFSVNNEVITKITSNN